MEERKIETIQVILRSTLGADEWELELPLDVPVQAIITRLLRMSELGFREQDDGGAPIPYRLMWIEGQRHLSETETLRGAGVAASHQLVMAYETRAGKGNHHGAARR